jgi:hypothetical protein
MSKKFDSTNILTIIGIGLAILLVVLFSTGTFSLIFQEADIIYATDANGNEYPVKITTQYECVEVQDCVNAFIKAGTPPSDIDESKITCENTCVVDFR